LHLALTLAHLFFVWPCPFLTATLAVPTLACALLAGADALMPVLNLMPNLMPNLMLVLMLNLMLMLMHTYMHTHSCRADPLLC
jgi:hypothetical protein